MSSEEDVQVGGGREALDQRDSASVAFDGDEPGSGQQVPRDHALHHLPRQHMRHDLVDGVRRSLRHAPRAA